MRLLDIARGQYTRSPAWLRRAVAPAVALLPAHLQFGKSYARWREDIARSRTDVAFVAERRTAALRGLVAKAMTGSPFWQARFETAFAGRLPDPATFTFADLERLPILTRDDIVAHGAEMLAAPVAEMDEASTSGSSGRPVVFYLDKTRSPKEWAFITHNWARAGYRNGDVRAVFRGLAFDDHRDDGVEWEPALKELRLSPWQLTAERMDRYLDLIEARGAAYLYGYPTCLDIFCRHLLRSGRRPRLAIRGVFPIGERIYAQQIAAISEALPGAMIVTQYGMSERVAFGCGVPADLEAYDMEPLYGHTEIVDEEGRLVTEPGRRGRIVGTGFTSTGMPFLRYETGDEAILVDTATAENGWRLRLREIVPRASAEFLVGAQGQRLDLNWFAESDPHRFAAVSDYQLHQDTPGRVTVRVVPAPGYGLADVAEFVAGMQRTVGGALALEPEIVPALEQNTRGKRKLTIQALDLSAYD